LGLLTWAVLIFHQLIFPCWKIIWLFPGFFMIGEQRPIFWLDSMVLSKFFRQFFVKIASGFSNKNKEFLKFRLEYLIPWLTALAKPGLVLFFIREILEVLRVCSFCQVLSEELLSMIKIWDWMPCWEIDFKQPSRQFWEL